MRTQGVQGTHSPHNSFGGNVGLHWTALRWGWPCSTSTPLAIAVTEPGNPLAPKVQEVNSPRT